VLKTIVIFCLLGGLMLQAGLEVDRDHLIASFKDGGMLLRAFLANFIIVPILAVLVVRLYGVDEFVGIGILLMAIAPGAPFLPFAAGRKKGGSTGLAVSLAFLMPALSVITAPITARFILPPDALANVRYSSFLVSMLVFQLLPLLVGLFISDRWPAVAQKLAKIAGAVFLLAVVVLFIVLGPKIATAFATVYGSRGLLASLSTVLLSALTGWLVGTGTTEKYHDTMAIATTLRNPGLATLLATQCFSNTVAEPAVLTYFIIQVVVGALIGVALKKRAVA
jgi:bile acid:Na+ symporter, BASS family